MVNSQLPLDLSEFEKILIYNCLMDQSYLETIFEHTKPSFFKNKDIKVVFEVLHSFYEEFGKVPNVTELKAHLVEDEQKQALRNVVTSFNNIYKSYDKDILIKNSERFLKERAVVNTVLSTSIDVQSGEINSTEILSKFEKSCNISLVDDLGFNYFEDFDKHTEELLKISKTISTGWKWLDAKIGGGFLAEGKSVYIFYGPTNSGKSIFLGNIAANVMSQNKTVVLISLEMSEQVYGKRISSCVSRIQMNDLQLHIEPLKEKIKSYKLKHQDARLIIKEFPPQSVTPLHVKTYIDKLVKKGIKPDMIIIDYIGIMAPPTKGLKSYEAGKIITEQLRALTYHFDCPLVSAVQTNRSGYKESNPGIETVAESMAVAHTADCAFSIWSDEGDVELGMIHLGITKNRFGPRDTATQLKIDYPTLTLSEIDDVVFNFTPKGKIPNNLNDESNPNISDILSSADILSED
jgi:replicative DNA helicase